MKATMTRLEEKVRAFLEEPRFAVLATLNRDGSSHLSAVWYELRSDELAFNTTATRVKHRNLGRDPRAALLVGEPSAYVRLAGDARRTATGDAAREDMRRLAIRYEGQTKGERDYRELYSKQERVAYALTPRRVYTYGL